MANTDSVLIGSYLYLLLILYNDEGVQEELAGGFGIEAEMHGINSVEVSMHGASDGVGC
jgi:hypothetical protein